MGELFLLVLFFFEEYCPKLQKANISRFCEGLPPAPAPPSSNMVGALKTVLQRRRRLLSRLGGRRDTIWPCRQGRRKKEEEGPHGERRGCFCGKRNRRLRRKETCNNSLPPPPPPRRFARKHCKDVRLFYFSNFSKNRGEGRGRRRTLKNIEGGLQQQEQQRTNGEGDCF